MNLDRIMLMALDKKSFLKRKRVKRAFAELEEGPTVTATEGRRRVIIPKGPNVMVEKRTGVYDCVRYKSQPPAHYERDCF